MNDIKTFEQTEMGKDFFTRINNLEEEIRKVERTERVRLYNIRQEWATKNNINSKFDKKYWDRTDLDEKKVSEVSKELREELSTLISERDTAFNSFKVKDPESWEKLVHRKVAPKVLQLLEKNPNGLTEVSVVSEVLGKKIKDLTDGQMHNRYCMVLYYMENLGWIKREGSGKAFDPKTSCITELGKKQLNTYNTNKEFDWGLQ